jgi:putative spermidine/putrescine transport system permease protein
MKQEHILIIPAIILTTIIIIFPVFELFKTSFFDPEFTFKHLNKFFSKPLYAKVLFNTVKISLFSSLFCFLLGYPTAYFIAHTNKKFRGYLLFLILLPFWISILIRSYSWMAVLGIEGVINTTLISLGLIDTPIRMLYTRGTVYLAMVQIMLPIMILTCYSSMIRVENDYVKAARILGASPIQAFYKIYFPLSFPGVASGSIIIFILSMGFFITPALVGGKKDMMIGNLINFQINQLLNWGFASFIGLMLLISTLIIVLLFIFLTRFKIENRFSN